MKLSLWQQFSSNHSASYTVVGQFESAAKAQAAAEALEVILKKISSWRSQLSQEERMFWGTKIETPLLTPPEEEFRQRYQVEWPFSLLYPWQWDRGTSPVSVVGSLVFIQNPLMDIHNGPQPFNGLMALWGGNVAFGVEESRSYPDTTLLLHLTCTAPDETTAESIVDRSNQYITRLIADFKDKYANGTSGDLIPWLVYRSGTRDERADEMKRIEAQALHETPVVERIRRTHPDLEMQLIQAKMKKDSALEAKIQGEFDQLARAALGGQDPIDWKEYSWVLDAMRKTALADYFLENQPELDSSTHRDGVSLSFNNLRFSDWVIGLRALSAWLTDEGCTDISYRFASHTIPPTKEDP